VVKITQRQKQLGAPARVPGQYYIRSTKYGLVLQAWPKKRSGKKTPAQFYKETEFALASSWASDPYDVGLAAAIAAAENTTMVPRDFLTAATYGTIITFEGDPNVNWVSYRSVTVNAQLTLDQVTDTVGSVMWRAEVGWVGIGPGSNGFVVTSWNGGVEWQAPTIGSGGIISYAVYDIAGAYSYAVPAAAQYLDIYMYGGGGGGGSGAKKASGTNSSGGGGGGGGAGLLTKLRTLHLPSSLALVVAAGGAGGVSQATNGANGNAGLNGGTSTITYNSRVLSAGPGGFGNGGTTGTASGGAGGGVGNRAGSSGGACGAGANGSAGTANTTYGATGGGGGSGQSAAPANHNGGAAGNFAPASGWPSQVAAGGVGSTATAPQTGLTYEVEQELGGGGGGGYAVTAGTASNGADGAAGGGGGGGGGASLNGSNSGAGGRGGDGRIVIVAY
jgi:hypothetical protein